MSGEARSMALGDLLDAGRKEEVESAAVSGLLGSSGEYQCGWLESTTCEIEAISAQR